jgi:hypothetical protein
LDIIWRNWDVGILITPNWKGRSVLIFISRYYRNIPQKMLFGIYVGHQIMELRVTCSV